MNIIFEGIDGVGKSTLINELINDLNKKKEIVRYIDEITQESPISNILSQMLSGDPFFSLNTTFPTSIFESLLLAADFHYKQEKYKYENGFNLYDRDFLSILSYQKEILKNDYNNYMDFYEHFKQIVMFNLKTIDLLVYVSVPIELSIERITLRDNIEYQEKEKEFLKTLKIALENELIPGLEKNNIKVLKLDGRETPKNNISKIYKEIGYEKN